jgi:hypothetical protein
MATPSTDPGNRGVSELERDVDAERARVSETLDALQAKASISNVFDEIVRAVGQNGGEVSRNLGRTLRDNPLPVILTGVGLAWLMAGSGGRSRDYSADYPDEWDDAEEDYYYRGYSGVATPPPPRRLGSETVPAGSGSTEWGDAPDYASGDSTDFGAEAYSADPGDETAGGPGMRERAAGALGSARDRAAGAAEDIRNRASDTAYGVRQRASDLTGAAQDRFAQAGAAARDARHAAWLRARDARRRAARAGHDARESIDHLMHEQPLVMGALALAVGAAMGGALPRSRTEDRMFGEQAERAKRTVREMAEGEGRKAMATAGAVADEARSIAEEATAEVTDRMPTGSEVVGEADRRAREAADRLKRAGTEEAERQNLGKPESTG